MISTFPPWARVSAAKGKAVHTSTHEHTYIHTHLGQGHWFIWDRKGHFPALFFQHPAWRLSRTKITSKDPETWSRIRKGGGAWLGTGKKQEENGTLDVRQDYRDLLGARIRRSGGVKAVLGRQENAGSAGICAFPPRQGRFYEGGWKKGRGE